MKRDLDEVAALEDCMKGMRVRSENSSKRMSLGKSVPVGSFYSVLTKNHRVIAPAGDLDDEDADDSTYENSESATETDEFTEESNELAKGEVEIVDVAFPLAEPCLLTFEPCTIDSGGTEGSNQASDYHPSDEGEGPEDAPNVMIPKRGKYLNRAALMVQTPEVANFIGLQPNSPYWVIKLARFSVQEKRWVNKGPVMLYFLNHNNTPRLVGNYLYSTKSICIDIILYEHLDSFIKHYNNNRCQFSTFKHGVVRHAETHTEKVPLNLFFQKNNETKELPVFACKSEISTKQEANASIYTFKFINQQGIAHIELEHIKFANFLTEMLYIVKNNALKKRMDSFNQTVLHNGMRHECTYLRSSDFIQQLAINGFMYYPISSNNSQFADLVQCTWCGTVLGPFQDIVDINSLHRAGHNQGCSKVSCPFIN